MVAIDSNAFSRHDLIPKKRAYFTEWHPFRTRKAVSFVACLRGYRRQDCHMLNIGLLGNAMYSNQALTISVSCTELDARKPQSVTLDQQIIERGAQALFQFVFSGTKRLDGHHFWANCDEGTKAGFRAEVRAVLEAVVGQADRNAHRPDLHA